RDNGNERLGEDGGYLQALERVSVAQDSSIECAVLQTLRYQGSERLVQMQLYLGIRLPVGTEDLGQRGQHGRSNESDMQGANVASPDAAGLIDVTLHIAQWAACALQQ